MRTIAFVVFMILNGVASVNAAPVYLSCKLTDSKSGQVTRIDITLDEATKQVSLVLLDHGLTESTTGVFKADTVFFVSPTSTGVSSIQYTINRVTLALQQTVRINAGPGRFPSVVEKEKGVFCRYPKNSNWLMG